MSVKRWWGIRHVRWMWYLWRAHVWARRFRKMGLGNGKPSEVDYTIAGLIWDGKA